MAAVARSRELHIRQLPMKTNVPKRTQGLTASCLAIRQQQMALEGV